MTLDPNSTVTPIDQYGLTLNQLQEFTECYTSKAKYEGKLIKNNNIDN